MEAYNIPIKFRIIVKGQLSPLPLGRRKPLPHQDHLNNAILDIIYDVYDIKLKVFTKGLIN